jgi:transcription antitermination factor NusG
MPENFTSEQKWYALAVPYQHEQRTQKALESKGLETLVPVYRSRRVWSDRVKETDTPLFGGYVFCRFDVTNRIPVMDTPGVVKIVGFGSTPAAVEASEITALQRIVGSRLPLAPWPYLKTGDRVRVELSPRDKTRGRIVELLGT